MTQRMIEITSPWFLAEETLAIPTDFSAVFGNKNPLALEIGCGIGDFITQLATRQPQRNFIAIDIYNKGCLKTCNRLQQNGLSNVRVIRTEARYLLAQFLTPESLAAVYINCPDPWPKKRHRKRRLVNGEFLLALLRAMRPGADLFFSSDVVDYALDVADQLQNLPGFENRMSAPVAFELADYPLSKYMRRFLAQGQPIHFIHHRLRVGDTGHAMPPQPVSRGFRSAWSEHHA